MGSPAFLSKYAKISSDTEPEATAFADRLARLLHPILACPDLHRKAFYPKPHRTSCVSLTRSEKTSPMAQSGGIGLRGLPLTRLDARQRKPSLRLSIVARSALDTADADLAS